MLRLLLTTLILLMSVPITIGAKKLDGLQLSGSGEVRYLGFIKVYRSIKPGYKLWCSS